MLQNENAWILTNLAYGAEETVLKILEPKYGILDSLATMMQNTSDNNLLD